MPGKYIKKEIDLTSLPRKKNGRIDWKNSIGHTLPFTYGNIQGNIRLSEYKDCKIKVQFENKEQWICSSDILNVKFGNLLGIRTSEHRFAVGDFITNAKGLNGTVVKTYRKGASNSKYYDICCPKCGYIFDISEPEIFKGRGWCPICDNQNHIEVLVGTNDMWTTHPEVAKQLLNPEDGYKYPFQTKTELQWKCDICSNPYQTKFMPRRIYDNYHGRVICKECNDGYSYPNKFIYNVLKDLEIEFIPEKSFTWSNGKVYDFYIPKYPMIIEAMGEQHSKSVFFCTIPSQEKNDKYKHDLALDNGIPEKYYLSIECYKSDAEHILNNLKNSILGDLYDLSALDLHSIEKRCLTTTQEKVAEYVNEGKSINEIIEILQCSYTTAKKYIRKAEYAGLCQYDWDKFYKISRTEQAYNQRQYRGKPFICVENNTAYMTLKHLDMNSEQIFGRRFWGTMLWTKLKDNKSYNGYHWKYITKEEFNKIKLETPEKAFGDLFELEEKVS